MPPRRLTFAVSTSLLTASLAVAPGCNKEQVNPGPQHPPDGEPAVEETVNEGPVAEPTEVEEPGEAEGEDAEAPKEAEPKHVNTRPEPEPE